MNLDFTSAPRPSARQLQWHALETYAFVHFGINTFTGREWGYGDEAPAIFNPTEFDADQIVGVAAAAGLKGLILTCKHHDGFCLWPSQFTDHSVKNSPWKNGQGDMVGEFSQACARRGLKFGIYLSPWDRNHAAYGTPAYPDYFRAQLRELLTNYGSLFEVWFDGANGGDGYYGGAREKRSIDNQTYYDWPANIAIVRELQPDACIFSDAGPDVRWVGNEHGEAGDPCWATIDPRDTWPGHADWNHLNRGDRDGSVWRPAEVDVSVRPGWFFHAEETIKPVSHLVQIYFESVGRGAGLNLNLTPDRRGLLPKNDVAVLKQWRAILSECFARDLASDAREAANENEQILSWDEPRTFNVISLREHLLDGQRVEAFALDAWEGEQWREFARATSIGNRRLIRLDENIETSRVRLRIVGTRAPAQIREFALFYLAPLQSEEPKRQLSSGAPWTIVRASSDESGAANLREGDPKTLWRAASERAEIVGELTANAPIAGFGIRPRGDGEVAGTPTHYAFWASDDADNWGEVLRQGEFSNIANNPIPQRVNLDAPVRARYFRFEVTQTVAHAPCTLAGFEVFVAESSLDES